MVQAPSLASELPASSSKQLIRNGPLSLSACAEIENCRLSCGISISCWIIQNIVMAIDALKRIGLWHEEVVMPRRMAVREFGCQPETEVVEVPTNDRLIDEMAHVLQLDEPMAGAGAVLSSLHVKSETEQALERAVSRYPL